MISKVGIRTIFIKSQFIGQLKVRELWYTVLIVLVELSSKEIQLIAFGIRKEAAPTLFTSLESCSPSRTPARSKRRAATNLGIDARIFRRDAEETTATAPITLRTRSLINRLCPRLVQPCSSPMASKGFRWIFMITIERTGIKVSTQNNEIRNEISTKKKNLTKADGRVIQ